MEKKQVPQPSVATYRRAELDLPLAIAGGAVSGPEF